MTVVVQEITDREQWNAFLRSQPGGHLLQSYEWGELTKYLGGRIYRLGALEGGQLIGAMMVSVAPVPLPVRLPGLQLNWLYSSRGPTVEAPDSPALPALITEAHAIARREGSVVLRLEPNIADDDPRLEQWQSAYRALGFRTYPYAVHPRRSCVLDIRPPLETLFANFKMTWRQNVRVAGRKGVIVREASSDADFDAYYALLKITSERDAFFIHSKDYHREILRQFATRGDAVLFLAEHEGEALAAKMLIRFGNWCWDMFGATANHKRNLKAAYLLQYRCIQWAKEQGCTHFDFRAIPEVLEPGEEMWGVYEYKQGFGGYSRLNMPTQDYVYRPLMYRLWSKLVEIRRERRRAERRRVELERAARGRQGGKPGSAGQTARPETSAQGDSQKEKGARPAEPASSSGASQ
ncbi:MAG: peptidoglycan bridge formation glycyltransferase FemA/FemB family protein [Thermogemmatispora sp.]|uniref:lipid II:glycine glycyltransferase FemX n=1 Tax=Thermogemmatispora sp. TaxID=1968838 RepID=UPI001A0C80AD|nr:peptidoglycan bridge formation glycyltransferase FemA/FemB family protein [Thermogemmatispora sp.]MBE3564209.1 peptidoglycan bridge formation glycyltransferase FemA/FemB family protein [Thermogemmatispora sp.]